MLDIGTSISNFDHWLFRKINSEWTSPLFDTVALLFRQPWLWMPLYLFLFIFVASNFRKNWWWWIILFACTVALTDLIGNQVFKQNIMRFRPCKDPEFMSQVRMLLDSCSGSSSFISNHAANHFGLATFFFLTMRHYMPKWVAALGFVWAFAIIYSQIYVGVHYPTDVIAGAVVGILFGTFTGMFFNKKFGFANFDKQPTSP